MRLMCMGINRDALSNGVNIAFQNLPTNTKKLSLEEYLMQRGYVPLQDDTSLQDEKYNRYKVRRIESIFLPFINNFREDFVFSSDILGWIKNPTEEQLNTKVPDNFPNTFNRTFKEYFAQYEEIDGDHYYSMHCYFEGYDNGKYHNRPTDPNYIEFWLFYDYFGSEKVVLNYEKPVKNII